MTIASIAGKYNTDDWKDLRITLYPTMVQFGGKVTEAIRIEKPIPANAPTVASVPDTAKELNDEIPW